MEHPHHMGARTDIHQTSTGVGHHWRDGYYFPNTDFKVYKMYRPIIYLNIIVVIYYIATDDSYIYMSSAIMYY